MGPLGRLPLEDITLGRPPLTGPWGVRKLNGAGGPPPPDLGRAYPLSGPRNTEIVFTIESLPEGAAFVYIDSFGQEFPIVRDTPESTTGTVTFTVGSPSTLYGFILISDDGLGEPDWGAVQWLLTTSRDNDGTGDNIEFEVLETSFTTPTEVDQLGPVEFSVTNLPAWVTRVTQDQGVYYPVTLDLNNTGTFTYPYFRESGPTPGFGLELPTFVEDFRFRAVATDPDPDNDTSDVYVVSGPEEILKVSDISPSEGLLPGGSTHTVTNLPANVTHVGESPANDESSWWSEVTLVGSTGTFILPGAKNYPEEYGVNNTSRLVFFDIAESALPQSRRQEYKVAGFGYKRVLPSSSPLAGGAEITVCYVGGLPSPFAAVWIDQVGVWATVTMDGDIATFIAPSSSYTGLVDLKFTPGVDNWYPYYGVNQQFEYTA